MTEGALFVFLLVFQTVYMHLEASFKVMARLVNQRPTKEQDEERRDTEICMTEAYMFRLVSG